MMVCLGNFTMEVVHTTEVEALIDMGTLCLVLLSTVADLPGFGARCTTEQIALGYWVVCTVSAP
jgi:hypothetical protein